MRSSCKNGLPVTHPDDDTPHASRNSLTQPAFTYISGQQTAYLSTMNAHNET